MFPGLWPFYLMRSVHDICVFYWCTMQDNLCECLVPKHFLNVGCNAKPYRFSQFALVAVHLVMLASAVIDLWVPKDNPSIC